MFYLLKIYISRKNLTICGGSNVAIKVIHVEGGLGNQMACYAVYVAAKESNPNDEFYIDTYLYDVKEAHSTISMWNGYELEKVFGVEIPDVRTLFSDEQVKEQIDYLRKSEFWKHDWNYAEVFIEMMKKYDLNLKNAFVIMNRYDKGIKTKIKTFIKSTVTKSTSSALVYKGKRIAYMVYKKIDKDCGEHLYEKKEGNYFYDITLDFMKSKFLQDKVGNRVRAGLQFNTPNDNDNLNYLQLVRTTESISVHIRRSDYLQFNEECYKFGYFPKCISYIKTKVENPVFFVFSDDLKWCKENVSIIGLSKDDKVYFVGINNGGNSFRDMQIMANCKHNIATKSSFGWWGSFLNGNPQKITCCQVGSYVCTKQF